MFRNKQTIKTRFIHKAHAMWGKPVEELTKNEVYQTFAGVVREVISENWIKTNKAYLDRQEKQVYYFSIEFLLGKLLDCNLINADIKKVCAEAMQELGLDLEGILHEEPDAGLGNGGLGRLAACFIDSIASLGLPGHGCGIRYKNGLFTQKIVENNQVELPDGWLQNGFVWEFRKADKAVEVRFKGNAYMKDVDGKLECVHENYYKVSAVPYDVPIVGYKNNTVNTLRLWNAEVVLNSDFEEISYDAYKEKLRYKHMVQRITKILYPDDSSYEGKELRLVQEYFFVSAGIQSIVRHYKRSGADLNDFHKKIVIHINDTHPALAIPELMRILMDEEGMTWEKAWYITRRTVAYTNHTILPEALEKWSIDMFKSLLPRIYMIVEEINRRFTKEAWERYHSDDKMRELSILWDAQVHMARLAVVGSFSVNGVAQIHSDILKSHTMRDFHDYYPGKFNNKTNGITHRRWLIKANPKLAELINQSIGPEWEKDPGRLINLLRFKDDKGFKAEIDKIKRGRKEVLAKYIKNRYKVAVDTSSIFDVQIKRIHSYKRQIMNILNVMAVYNRMLEDPNTLTIPRTVIFAGKAAPSYHIAKLTIKLISKLSDMINNDKRVNDKLKVLFLENYSVSLGELLFPATDISEQISTASKEASGTGNMKFMMNGAITLGTLDGANVEIRNAVGDDHCIIFGLKAEEVLAYYENGQYSAWDIYNSNIQVKTVLEQLINGFFPNSGESFRALYDFLLYNNDEFFVLKDFDAYSKARRYSGEKYRDREAWLTSSIVNIAHSGIFSSDRTIKEYAEEIWDIKPVKIK
ncbi:glycogen/starch/alpha-glucan phosphorylase [Anaerosinus gibii]|uniref:Alpha-1,4 glucan phosphorylase n=1 Tax=Selenobaculum gibii TaxID=3054208 RepID=A0A9Y2AIX0_9FIRM|nr:glycogen/starch/alpha-glucan phosphorylase [Selenobaculum gbiensis]WIW70838.1 glycogen/starch/alpha-glucan phosphorylase [Selenobaculum gbiensis]